MKSVILLLFFISWTICSAIYYECPPPEILAPCKCSRGLIDIEITCSNITDVKTLQELFEKPTESPFTQFRLEYSNVPYIPVSGVASKRMERITIRNSTMTSLFDAPPTENNTLSLIVISSAHFPRDFRWELMNTLSNLRLLSIKYTEFRKLDKNFAENIASGLNSLFMYKTKTTTLDDMVFAKMTQIERIEFFRNEVSTLKRSMFANPSKLLHFDFSYNHIETLPDDIFHGMDKLEEINLNGNRIKYFYESVFGGYAFVNALNFIYLEDNPIVCDCSMKWLFYTDGVVYVSAWCSEPTDKAQKFVRDLTKSDFNYCQTRTNTVWDAIE